MLNLSLAGNVGRDAAYKQTQNGQELCSFPVAVNVGFGDSKTTIWVDVTKWGKGARGLSGLLMKGSKVAVTGQMSTREHEGKTYIQCNASDVTIMGATGGEGRAAADPYNQERHKAFNADNATPVDLDDEIPF
jgi:single-strand DNA-binding protein